MREPRRFVRCLVVLGVLLAGCATTPQAQQFLVRIDSLARADSLNKRVYVLLPGNKGTNVGDLQFQEYAAYVHRALAARGLIHGSRIDTADIVVFLSYGIGDPQTHYYTYSLPVWGQTGYSGSTTSGTVNTFGGYGTYSTTTTYTPTYGVTGYSTQLGATTTYFRFIVLDAYDLDAYKRDKKLAQVWRSAVTSTGTSDDLRRVFPIMVAGSAHYFGTNPGRKIEIVLDENHQAVRYIKDAPISQPISPTSTSPQPTSVAPMSPLSPQPKSAPMRSPKLHFCDLGMEWDNALGQCVKMREK
jgi:hypothetical protein